MERLAEAVSVDEERFAPAVRAALRELELTLEQEARQTEQQAAAMIAQGKREQADALLNALMESAADRLMSLAKALFAELQTKIKAAGGLYGPRKGFLEDYCARVAMKL